MSHPRVTQEPTYSGLACEGLSDELCGLPLRVPQAALADHRILEKMLDDVRVRTFHKVSIKRGGSRSLLTRTEFAEESHLAFTRWSGDSGLRLLSTFTLPHPFAKAE